MKTILKIARIELEKIFYSPIAWLILIIFTIQAGLSFMPIMESLVKYQEFKFRVGNLTNMLLASQSGWFNGLLSNIYLYIPLLTMGIFSKEFSSGTIKLLYSSPISNRQIVLGKFLSTVVFAAAMIFILSIFVCFSYFVIDNFDLPLALTGLLGIFLLICTYSAIGIFFSALTSYQVVAAMGTFAAFFVLNSISGLWQGIDFIRDITYWLSISGRCQSFVMGLICTEDFLYFILVSVLFLLFTILKIKGKREKSKGYISLVKYLGVFSIIAILGYLSTNPYLMSYYDSTHTKVNTLTQNSQKIIEKIEGKTTITTYVNIHESTAFNGLPSSINRDLKRYRRYRRFKPDIEFKYKYYYAPPTAKRELKHFKRRFSGMSEKEILKKVAKMYEVDVDRFKPKHTYKNEIDLTDELHRFVRRIETKDGKVSILRTYNDNDRFPYESQKTAAFKRFVVKAPIIGFVSGHKERDVNNTGDRGFHTIAKDKTFRASLLNNGVDYKEIDLSKPIDNNINIIVLAEAREPYSSENIKVLNDYIAKGGNAIIACDRKRQEVMNPIVESLGVKFLPGQVVEYNKSYDNDLLTCEFTKLGRNLTYQFNTMNKGDKVVVMPGAVALSYKDSNKGFKAIPVLKTDSVSPENACDTLGSWNEIHTTNFIDDKVTYDPKSEVCGPHTMALALTRNINDKEQKIMILGDADCLSNGEAFGRYRRGIRAVNFDFISGLFSWMTDNEAPIDVRRPSPIDNDVKNINIDNLGYWKFFFHFVLGFLLLAACLIIWLRRRSR